VRMQRARAWVRHYVYPPTGHQVRRLIAMISLAVGLPRLPGVAELFAFAPHRFGEPEFFGFILTAVGIALMFTSYHGRLTVYGRMVAGLGFVAWVTLAAATLSVTSLLIDVTISASLFFEIVAFRHE